MKKELVMQELPVDFCHASTIALLEDGSLACAWFGGSREGNPDVAIYFAKRNAEGQWTAPQRLIDGPEANWNPVLLVQQGELWLFCKQGQEIKNWKTLIIKSLDGGITWSLPKELVHGDISGGRGPVRNKCLIAANGRLLAGCSTERGIWQAYADYSDDAGISWEKSGAIAIEGLTYAQGEKTAESSIAVSEQSFYGRGVIQPSLWESAPGRLHMLLRSSEGYVYRADSEDNGTTWSAAYALELPNNNSGLDVVRAPWNGRLYLLCNPVAANWGRRSPLTLLESADNGYSWKRILDLETAPEEFSYPCLICAGGEAAGEKTDQNRLIMSYTYGRRNIALIELTENELS